MSYYVICDDDDGRITLAARRAFASADEARRYADTVASTRRPFVVADAAVALLDSLGTNLNSKES